MALRTLESPGVEIHETDKSNYSPSMVGTKCYVMGYSEKGEPYQPMQFTSKASLQNFYGEPQNEAERYFYNACSEVLNQNGVLYSARIPYDNESTDRMTGFKFKVSTKARNIPSAGKYLKIPTVWSSMSHDKDFEQDALDYTFDNLLNREIDGKYDSLELDTELRTFYKNVLTAFDTKYNGIGDRYSVEYYEAIASASTSLSARFVSKEEAVEYLREYDGIGVEGEYKYYTGDECICCDGGDWIVNPIYCEYNKVVSCETFLCSDTRTLGEISAQVKDLMDKNPNPSTAYIEPMTTTAEIAYNVDILDGIVTVETQRETIGDIRNWLKQSQAPDEYTKEMRKYTALRYIDEKLSGTISVDAINVYGGFNGINSGKITFVVPKYPFKTEVNDGYDNEPMFRETVSSLYDTLSNQFENNAEVKKLISGGELWHAALSCSLCNLIRERTQTFQQFKSDWNASKVTSWDEMLGYYADNAKISFKDIVNRYGGRKWQVHSKVPYYPIVDATSMSSMQYLEITNSECPVACSLYDVDLYKTGESKVAANTFWIFDKTSGTLNSVMEDTRKGKNRQLIGMFPIITTAANALYAQQLIEVDSEFITDFETVCCAVTRPTEGDVLSTAQELLSSDIVTQFSNAVRTKEQIDNGEVLDTISRTANEYFSKIDTVQKDGNVSFDGENMKKIGVVVVKAYLDASEGNKVSFSPVESFCGSLLRGDKNPNNRGSVFIDEIVNNNSEYIYMFSNCFVNDIQKKIYADSDILIKKLGKTGMLGWFKDETNKTISISSMMKGMERCLHYVSNRNEMDIDIVCDAGLANIAQYMRSVYDGIGAHEYDMDATNDNGESLIGKWKCVKDSDTKDWKNVVYKYDNFCKNIRKDCMYIVDCPRPLVLNGQNKIVRPSNPSNTIDGNILPYVKYCTGINSNYGAGYMCWFQMTDDFTGDMFWCPPSIKAMGAYINTDLNFNYWDAPAGMTRGIVQAIDVAFSPTSKQSGPIYTKNWNYAVNYPNDGIILEGQKTFQSKYSALDRVNVRRLMLRLERQVGKVLRYIVYEGNTSYLRQRVIDLLDPYFKQSKIGGGIADYKIVCDESNNTPTTIDNNELHIQIGIKPVKTIEFIICNFTLLPTGVSWSEM